MNHVGSRLVVPAVTRVLHREARFVLRLRGDSVTVINNHFSGYLRAPCFAAARAHCGRGYSVVSKRPPAMGGVRALRCLLIPYKPNISFLISGHSEFLSMRDQQDRVDSPYCR